MHTAIIVAAGSGTRMGRSGDKLFIEIAGQPLVAHTWRRFDNLPEIAHVVLVVRPQSEPVFERLAVRCGFRTPYSLTPGGAHRQESVAAGLAAVPDGTEIVLIHDGARPCTHPDDIRATIAAARDAGAAVAATRVTDTIKESAEGRAIDRHLDRSRLWAVQTPQVFRLTTIRRAIQAAHDSGRQFTDDTAACQAIAQEVRLVESRHPNPKATTPSDLAYLELLLADSRADGMSG